MGNRRKNITPAIVIDLDGTLVSVNTFHHFMLFVAKIAARKLQIFSLLRIFLAVASRALRIVHHSTMKHAVMKIAAKLLSESQVHYFASKITKHTNKAVENIITDAHRRGAVVILASAAPALYASHIAVITGCDHCIATEMPNRFRINECRGPVKLARVTDFLSANNMALRAVVTDHHDDLPLIQASIGLGAKTILVSPHKATINALRNAGISCYSTL